MTARALLRMFVVVTLTSSVAAPFLYAICRAEWEQKIYYTGCGATLQYAGEHMRACKEIDDYENDQQDGDWMVRYNGECIWAYGNCLEEGAYSVTYWHKCNNSWVAKSESDFNNGNCQCQ